MFGGGDRYHRFTEAEDSVMIGTLRQNGGRHGVHVDDGVAHDGSPAQALLSVRGLGITLNGVGVPTALVQDLSLTIRPGEIVALAGESGSGKSLTALALARLCPPGIDVSAGRIMFRGDDVLSMDSTRLRRLRGGDIAYIFQEPAESMNPVRRVGGQITEAFRLHGSGQAGGGVALSAALADVGLSAEVAVRYPHQLSGGMLQRAMIAMALASRPAVLVADEPTTALDVTVQAQILSLLRRVRDRTRMGVLLITHNLGVVAETADKLYMMYAGRMVETGPVDAVLQHPRHPYTQALLEAVPRLRAGNRMPRSPAGRMPDPGSIPPGCAFHPRCQKATQRCARVIPTVQQVDPEHDVRCHYWM